MAKNRNAADVRRNGVVRDRSQLSGTWVKRNTTNNGRFREILFPTEPTSIDHKKIDRAVERVVSRKK